jgi:hypothetical protein
MKPIYIFDLDGTLALIEHRRHFVEYPSKACTVCAGVNRKKCTQCAVLDAGFKTDWRAFFAACVDDVPNLPVIKTLQALQRDGAEVWIWSGRSDEVREETIEWLCKYGCMGKNKGFWLKWFTGAPERFRMRKAGDHQDDVALKAGWLAEIEPPEYARLVGVFEDRDRVVKMWRDAGITCFQVAPGNF